MSNAVSQGFARKVEAEGVTVAEWVLLRVLLDAGEVAPSTVAARMAMTRGAISKLSDRLVEKGLIERRDDPQDRRALLIGLSAAGRRIVPRLAELADRNDAEFFGSLSGEQRQQLGALLRTIVTDRDLGDVPVD